MADVLTYVLHYEGTLNKNSLGAVSEGAARAAEIGGQQPRHMGLWSGRWHVLIRAVAFSSGSSTTIAPSRPLVAGSISAATVCW